MKKICLCSIVLLCLAVLAGCDKAEPSACEHVTEVIPRVEPNCVETGLSEGAKCSKCDTVVTPGEAISATGRHEYGADGLCVVCQAEKPKPTEGLKYQLSDDGSHYIVSGIGTATATDIVIADEYEGLPVTEIGRQAFYGCDTLTSVLIPEGVTSIGGTAFTGCSSLTSVHIPESVSIIGDGAFWLCHSLTSVTIPDSVTTIEVRAFSGCSSLTSVTIPDSVTTIAEMAFSGCSSLTSVTIPDSVTTIEAMAFWGCSSLTSVTIPDSVTTIEEAAFSGCSSLTNITIPNGVTTIESGAFMGCSSLESIDIPESVTFVGGGVFSGCNSQMSLTAAESNPVYHVSGNCLIETESKTVVAGFASSVLPTDGSITAIGEKAFSSCGDLTDITIPTGVTSIGADAFSGCSGLTEITIPDSVTELGDRAFAECTSLARVSIGNGITEYGYELFAGCGALCQMDFPSGVPYDHMKNLFAGSEPALQNVDNTIYMADWVVDVHFQQTPKVTLHENTKGIAPDAFDNCVSLKTIDYAGTVEQWEALIKVDGWDADLPDYTVQCTDGTVTPS